MMACVDFVESVGVSEGFIDCPSYCPPATFGWLSPRISFSKDFVESDLESIKEAKMSEEEDKSGGEDNDFEFCLSVSDESLSMLPADELFYQGKLMPLQFPSRAQDAADRSSPAAPAAAGNGAQAVPGSADPCAVSPKAPKCSSRWKEILGLKKLQAAKQEILPLASPKPGKTSLPSKNHLTPKSLKQLFKGSESKPSPSDPSGQPLLSQQAPRDSDADSASGRLSVSSSCGPDLEDLPRYSMDSERGIPIRTPLRVTVRKPRCPDVEGRGGRAGRSSYRNPEARPSPRGSSVDSPRMNSSGKIVFQSLERSCSSPSSFSANVRNKDPHYRNARQKENWRGMERSYSANVRVAPVLNVPVCSLRASKGGGASSKGTMFGLTQLFSPQKRDTSNRPVRNAAQPSSIPSSSHLQKREG